MLKIKGPLKNLFFSLFLICFASCELFQNDVVDYMEQFTGTAAIEEHEINVLTYKDSASQLCISSEEAGEITFYMRNPKSYVLEPSVTFEQLDGGVNRSAVQINQTDSETIRLELPKSFLIDSDGGQDITAQIDLYEPMSGRYFERYTVDLHCNTIPPEIVNPTIINNNNSTFAIAFDLPSPEEAVIRHKDICAVVINGQTYEVKVSAIPNPEAEGSYKAYYEILDSRFSRQFRSGYSFINGKTFDHNDDTSFYFDTGEPYNRGDKQYNLVLKDGAGLSSTVKTSTFVAKLAKPVIKNQVGYDIEEGRITGIPYNEETKTGSITIIPPSVDHLGNPVSGAVVHYKIFELNGTPYASGSTAEAITLALPQNTYRVEAYATLSNFENSSTKKVKFRFLNNTVYVRACTSAEGFAGDGTETAPYASFAEAVADINAREPRSSTYTICVEGDFSVNTYTMNPDTGVVTGGALGALVLDDINADEILVTNSPGASTSIIKSLTNNSDINLTIKDITIKNTSGTGLTVNAGTVIFNGSTVTGCSSDGVLVSGGTFNFASGTISNNNSYGITAEGGIVNVNGGTISGNGNGGIWVRSGTHNINGGTISENTQGVVLAGSSTLNVTGGRIRENSSWGVYQLGGTLYLSGGSITENQQGGVQQTNIIKVSGNPYVYNNVLAGSTPVRQDIVLAAGKNIDVAGTLASGCKLGIKVDSARTPTAIGEKQVFTSGYSNSDSPSKYFVSNNGFAILRGTGSEAAVALSGASGTSTYSADDYSFTFTVSPLNARINEAKTVTITPTVKRREISGAYTTLTYNTADGLLYDSAGVEASSVAGELLTVTAAFYDGIVKVQNLTLSPAAGNTYQFTVPAQICISNYKIIVKATFCGTVHSTEFNYVVSDLPVGFVLVPGITIPATTAGVSGSSVFIANRALTIPNLIVCDHEVTQAEYVAVMGSNPSNFSSNPASGEIQENRPVEGVSWYEALVYCNKRSMAEGLTPCYEIAGSTDPDDWGTVPTSTDATWNAVTCNFNANGYRLPTEAEWEYCARGGDLTGEQTTHSGTNEDNLSNYAWYSGNSNTNSKTHEVGKLSPNAKGLYDMSGNVWEWCWDRSGSISTSTGATGPSSGSLRVCRGGSWNLVASYCAVSSQDYSNPYNRNNNLGFRVVRSAQ